MTTLISAENFSDYGLPQLEMRLRRARLGLGVAVIGILMVFVSFTSAYVVRQGLPTLDPRTNTLVRDWFPLPLPGLLFFNTGMLLISSVTMELARRQAARFTTPMGAASIPNIFAGREGTILWLALTAVLGLGFLRGQWVAWRELAASGFYVATSPSSSFVYLLTGTHGVHLLGGIFALLVAAATILFRRPAESRVVVLDVTAWYWHFMTLLWIYILSLLEFAR
jgi:cytochrome c oxidase subunit III